MEIRKVSAIRARPCPLPFSHYRRYGTATPATAGRSVQITVRPGHVDNPARSVKFDRSPRRQSQEACAAQENAPREDAMAIAERQVTPPAGDNSWHGIV